MQRNFLQHKPALEQAVQLSLLPSMARSLRARPLPNDMETLLHILAREPDAEVEACRLTGKSVEVIREAAEFYVEQILFRPGASAYRILGREPGASREELRANMALLLRWLHPDCQAHDRHMIYLDQVRRAWTTLQHPESRAEYDRNMTSRSQPDRRLAPPRRPVRPPFFLINTASSDRRYRRGFRARGGKSHWNRWLIAFGLLVLAAAIASSKIGWISHALEVD